MSKIIKAVFTGRFCKTQRVFRFDTDDKLQIVNVDLPANYTVDFSNSKTGDSVSVLATSDTVQIPPDLFVPGSEIYAWIWLSDSNGGHTRCEATIPIDPRARRTGTEPTPAQASAWDEAVDTLNETIEGIPTVINSALTEAKESGEFNGKNGADGNGIWWVDAEFTRIFGNYIQAQVDHMQGRAGASSKAKDLCVISDGRLCSIYRNTANVSVLMTEICNLSGTDGTSPSVTITEITGGHRVTITDEAHPSGQSFDVMDGQGGGGGTSDYSDLSNKPSIEGVTLSGNKTASDLGLAKASDIPAVPVQSVNNKTGAVVLNASDVGAGTYSKPSGGIPTTDMAEDVQASLAKANTALQDHQSLAAYRTAADQDLIDRQQNTAIAAKYAKPAGGIPASDLASAVQTSLGKADTALQEHQSLEAYRTAADQDVIDAAQDTVIAGKLSATGDAYRTASIPMGHLDAGSTATVMTATIPGITELRDGVCVWLENGVIASASGVTLNINSLGAKPIYNSLSGAIVTTTFTAASTYLFVYNSTRVTGGCWDMVYGYDTNTTYTPVKLGFGYATCSTAEATAAKTAALSGYTLTTGGIVAVKFANAVPAGATLNINSKGAKAIYYKGAAITDGVIKAGDTVTMVYSTYYHVISIDRENVSAFTNDAGYLTESTVVASADNWLGDALAGIDAERYVLVVASGTSGAAVTHYRGFVQTVQAWMSAKKLVCAFGIPKSASPSQLTDFDILAVAEARNMNLNTGQIEFGGISGGKLYSTVLSPSGSDQMTGTLTVTDLALSNAQGVSF